MIMTYEILLLSYINQSQYVFVVLSPSNLYNRRYMMEGGHL